MTGEQDKANPPEPTEADGTGGPEESGAGYGNNAGYQGEAEPEPNADDKAD